MGSGGGAQQAPNADGEQRNDEDGEEQPREKAVSAGDQVDEADLARDEHAAGEDRGAAPRACAGAERRPPTRPEDAPPAFLEPWDRPHPAFEPPPEDTHV